MNGATVARPLDAWNPLTPLAASVFLVVFAYAGPQPWSGIDALAIALLLAWRSGVGRGTVELALAVAVPTVLIVTIMNGVLAPPPDTTRWVATRGAALDSLLVAIRLAAAIAALGWIVLAVPPRRLTRALAARGLPAWGAYVIVASLEAVPQAKRRADEVLDAQRCRGLEVGGGIMGRIRALVPLAGPLIVGLVTESEERALALEARGFRPRRARTTLEPIADPPRERWMRRAIWLALVLLIAWRVLPWERVIR